MLIQLTFNSKTNSLKVRRFGWVSHNRFKSKDFNIENELIVEYSKVKQKFEVVKQ